MAIAGEYGNIPSWITDWTHCCDFEGDTCDDLRWSSVLLETQNRRKMAHFIASCGRALKGGASFIPFTEPRMRILSSLNCSFMVYGLVYKGC